MPELSVATPDGVLLSGEESGSGPAIILLHGLTATRRYVVHGSRMLERAGHRVIAYDARGHGRSTPPASAGARVRPDGELHLYCYPRLAGDLGAVLEARGVERGVLVGVSMGAHTIVRFALDHPERVSALAIVTPAFDPENAGGEAELAEWDALARGLREGGVAGFLAAYDLRGLSASLRETVATVIRQRMAEHEHPDAVADALEAVPRLRPFEDFGELAALSVPVVVVASRDEADPRHPLAVGERYVGAIPGARMHVEEEGKSPLAWQGGQISKIIAELAGRA